MKISAYSFGSITIDGSTFSKDVIICPERIISPWWREEGHSISKTDLKEVLNEKIELLIIGTGWYGAMDVPGELLEYLRLRNIAVLTDKTPDAVDEYNERAGKVRTVAALHLTC